MLSAEIVDYIQIAVVTDIITKTTIRVIVTQIVVDVISVMGVNNVAADEST